MRPSPARLAAWLLSLTAAGVALWLLGHTALASPPLTSAHWSAWAGGRDPLTGAMAVLRVGALAVTAYLWAITALHLAASLSRCAPLQVFAGALTVPAARRLLGGAAGMGLSAAVLLVPLTAAVPHSGGPAAASDTATMHEAPPAGTAPQRSVLPDDDPAGHDASEHEIPPPSPPVTSAATTSTSTSTSGLLPPLPAAPTVPQHGEVPLPTETQQVGTSSSTRSTTWVVKPGDNFWFAAADLLTQAMGRPPSDAEIVPYWHSLIEANRSNLADPANPDLIFPGQRFTLPPPPAS